MRLAIRFNLLIQLLLITLRRYGNRFLHMLLQVRIRLDVRSVHEHHLRRQVACPGDLLQNPPEHALDYFSCEPVPECIADRRKVWQTLRHGVPQKPAVGHVHFRVPQRLAQRADAEQVLEHHQLEQHHRVTARPSVVLAVQVLDQIVDAREIHRRVDLPQQMVFGHQHVHTQHLDCLSLFRLSRQHFHHLYSVYQKRPH